MSPPESGVDRAGDLAAGESDLRSSLDGKRDGIAVGQK
jgi:hypothetical protein